MTARTPLAHARGLGPAHSGTDHWWHQRLTAVANVPLVLFLLWLGIRLSSLDHAGAVSVLKHPLVALGTIAALINIGWHMRLGMQVVVEDYVHGPAKLPLLVANIFYAAAVALVSAFAVLVIVFGA